MTSEEQRRKLQAEIWNIANKVRGAVDGWDFKQYVLGSLFLRFIGELFAIFFYLVCLFLQLFNLFFKKNQ